VALGVFNVSHTKTGRYSKGEILFRDYRVHEYIDEGGYGSVYVVKNKTGRFKALKVLHRDVRLVEKEMRGINDIINIQSVRLVYTDDYGTNEYGETCILSEYIKENIGSLLQKKGKLNQDLACHYFMEILEGLRILEQYGIIHRDIKPENLFILDRIIKIGDFSLARVTSGKSLGTRGVGTMAYMAPEAFEDEYTQSVDRWAAAVVLFQMLTNTMPFAGKTDPAVMNAIINKAPDIRAVPQRFHGFFERCLKKDPARRHENIDAMMTDFRMVLKGDFSVSMPMDKPVPVLKGPLYTLRSEPLTVSQENFKTIFGLDSGQRPLEYITNDYQDTADGTLTDHATGLMWQQGSSSKDINYQAANDYIRELNRKGLAGFSDWRLPTIPELMSLIEPKKKNGDLYIDPLFDKEQWWCWSSDVRSGGGAWNVYFSLGIVYWNYPEGDLCVRAVRQRQ